MPGCQHPNHTHHPWPFAGPLVICPGERTCGYCVGDAASKDHQSAHLLRKHVFNAHTSPSAPGPGPKGKGEVNYQGVEVMLYDSWRSSGKEARERDAGGKFAKRVEGFDDGVEKAVEDEDLEPCGLPEYDDPFPSATAYPEEDGEDGVKAARNLAVLGATTIARRGWHKEREREGKAGIWDPAARVSSEEEEEEGEETVSKAKPKRKSTKQVKRPVAIDTKKAQASLFLPRTGMEIRRSE